MCYATRHVIGIYTFQLTFPLHSTYVVTPYILFLPDCACPKCATSHFKEYLVGDAVSERKVSRFLKFILRTTSPLVILHNYVRFVNIFLKCFGLSSKSEYEFKIYASTTAQFTTQLLSLGIYMFHHKSYFN